MVKILSLLLHACLGLAANSDSLQHAAYTFAVRASGQIDMTVEVDYRFEGDIPSRMQAPIWSNGTSQCLSEDILVSVGGQRLESQIAPIDGSGVVRADFSLSNLSQVTSSVNSPYELKIKLEYIVKNGVCRETDGLQKLYFPWVNAWNTSVLRSSYKISFPEEQTLGVTEFVCFGAAGMETKCGRQMNINGVQNWARYTSDVTLHDAFFQWDVPRTLSDVACPTKTAGTGPLAAVCTQSTLFLNAWPKSNTNLIDSEKGTSTKQWLAGASLVCAVMMVIIMGGGCLTRKCMDEEEEEEGVSGQISEVSQEREGGDVIRPKSPQFHPGVEMSLDDLEPEPENLDVVPTTRSSRRSVSRRQSSRSEFSLACAQEDVQGKSWSVSIPTTCAMFQYRAAMLVGYWFGAQRFLNEVKPDVMDPFDWFHLSKNDRRQAFRKNFRRPVTKGTKAQTKGQQGGEEGSQDDNNSNVLDEFGDVIAGGAEIEGKDQDLSLAEAMLTGQAKPWFIITQCVVAFGLWAGCAILNSQDDSIRDKTYAGLDSLSRGNFDLLLTRPAEDTCVDYRLHFWRWFTYQFTHGSLTHVGMNCFANILYGIPLEGLDGTFKIFLMYNVGVWGGACFALVNDPHVPVIGMSGGCYALIGMNLADLIMNWHNKRYRFFTLGMIITLAVVDWLTFLWSTEGISHSAHVGGYLSGCLVYFVVGKNVVVDKWEKVLIAFTILVGIGICLFCFSWSLAQWPPMDIWEEVSWCWARQINLRSGPAVCIRCVGSGSQKCIDDWNQLAASMGTQLRPVSVGACRAIGWYGE